jgi:hypothetical protein
MASASSSNATCSITVCSTPSSRAHSLLNRTPFHPLEPSLQTAGNLVGGRRAVMEGSSGHPRISHKSQKVGGCWGAGLTGLLTITRQGNRVSARMPDTYHTAGLRRGPPPQTLRRPGHLLAGVDRPVRLGRTPTAFTAPGPPVEEGLSLARGGDRGHDQLALRLANSDAHPAGETGRRTFERHR